MSAKLKPEPEDDKALLKDIREIPALRKTKLERLVTKKVLLDQDKHRAEEALEIAKAKVGEVGDAIEGILKPLGLKGVIVNHQPVRIMGTGGQRKINENKLFDRLLEERLPADKVRTIITDCTDTAKESTYVRVYPAKA